jgi:hypothetical protein
VKRKLIHILGFSLSTKAQGNRGSACLLALVLAGAVPSFANTLTVTNTNDSGSGSLRDAIAAANAGDTIEFSVTGTITLTSAGLTLNKSLTIKGPGAAQLAISGNSQFRVFFISSGTVVISGLSIEKGSALGNGNAIANAGTLTLTHSTVSGSGSNQFSGNSGGGIANAGILTLHHSTVSNNSVDHLGGGIYNISGTVTVVDSTVSDNLSGGSEEGGGGGIYNDSGTIKVVHSTISGNTATNGLGGGAGIWNGGAATVANSTVAGNVEFNRTGSFSGGGIGNAGTLTLINTTVTGNSANDTGGGLFNVGTSFTIKSTLLASNDSAGNCDFSAGTVTSLGYNVSDDGTCSSFLTAGSDENNVTPGAGLDPKGLEMNGGPTQTIALLPGSPAVDHIPVADCTDAHDNRVITDQRGVKRPQGPACDVGAFELVQTVPFSDFTALLAIQTGHNPSFGLTARFTLGAGSDGVAPLTQPVTLQLANYTVEIPAGSFHPLWNSPSAPYIYEGTIDGTKLVVGVMPLGRESYEFSAVGSPVSWVNVTNPVTVSLTVGNDGGSTPVRAFIGNH